MKKLFVLVSFLMVLVMAPMVLADTVSVDRVAGYYSGNGGEFTLFPSFPVPSDYVSGKTSGIVAGAPNFQSFCVETTEYVRVQSGAYEVRLNTGAVFGNGGGDGSFDPLSAGAAWLYHQFQLGILSGYDYTPPGRDASADLLQKAIWFLEDESGGVNNSYVTLVVTQPQFGTLANAKANNNGQYPVGVLNLWDVGYVGISGHQHQDQLICVPAEVPEPGTLLLVGAGLLGLGAKFRRRKK
jgi:hypothetical protein